MAGSIGPRFLSAARRVLDIGRLVSAASACSDKGPAGRMSGSLSIQKLRQPGGILYCIFLVTYLHSENQKLS